MADVTKVGTPSLSTPVPPTSCLIGPLKTGEAIAAGDACYIKSDGKVWKSTAAADAAAKLIDGFAMEAVASGYPITLYRDVTIEYGSGLTPGARYYLSAATAGALADAASTHAKNPAGFAVDATRIRVNAVREVLTSA